MGCDIHMCTEVMDRDGAWRCCDRFKLNKYYGEFEEEQNEYELIDLYDDRDYYLFSVLAGVRNYSEQTPISDPRGLPSDVSAHVKKRSDDYGSDGHSHSWLTLAELIEYQKKNEPTKYSGLMSPEDAAKVDSGGTPSSWCQATSMKSYVYREGQRCDDVLGPLIDLCVERLCEEFWIRDEEKIKDEQYGMFRIVFWFDN